MRMRVGKAMGLAALSFLAGCVAWTGPVSAPAQRPSAAAAAYFDFSWELSGDRQAAPLQVFDDGLRMWLQFSSSQGEPGLWRPAPDGDLLAVDYRRQGPYLVLEQVWPELLVQAAGRQARVRRQAAGEPAIAQTRAAAQSAGRADIFAAVPAEALSSVQLHGGASLPDEAPELLAPGPSVSAPGPDAQAATTASAAAAVTAAIDDAPPPGLSFAVERVDGHMRRTLARWAEQAGWLFQAEHWSVDVDIPIAGDAVFDMPFEQAVQALLGATELSDRPLQPCFYSNKVVRVVAYAQACDRTAPPGERA